MTTHHIPTTDTPPPFLALRKGLACVECENTGDLGDIVDNGEKGRDRTYCCTACGGQWDRGFVDDWADRWEAVNGPAYFCEWVTGYSRPCVRVHDARGLPLATLTAEPDGSLTYRDGLAPAVVGAALVFASDHPHP